MIEGWGNLPSGWSFGAVMSVAVDSQDRVYAGRLGQDPPILVLDREGNYLSSFGSDAITDPHGLHIGPDDVIHLVDKDDHVAAKFTLDGRPLMVLGNRDQPSDTGCEYDGGPVSRAAGPFNKPSWMVPSPSGELYVTDGYRNSRVHRFSPDGRLISSWGSPGNTAPGDLHLPHCLCIDREGRVYVADRNNSRIQVFSATGDFIAQWTDLHHPSGIYMDAEETIYVTETTPVGQEPTELPPRTGVWDKEGNLLARWESPAAHGICGDSTGDLYLSKIAGNVGVSKLVRRR
jgi:sugar lactone lactonase YvrE